MANLKYYKNLDGVRAIAALLVMNLHFFNEIEINSFLLNILFKFASIGQTGVTLFFVLSGFLITRILINNVQNSGSIKNFYIRRVLRIFPLYYLFLFISLFLYPLLFNYSSIAEGGIYYFFYIQNIAMTFNYSIDTANLGHFWSLAVEEHYYLIWPIAILFLNKNNIIRLISFLIIGSLLLRIFMFIEGFSIDWFTMTRVDSLAIGSLLAFKELDGSINKKNSIFFLVAVLLLTIIMIFTWYYFNYEDDFIYQTFKYTFWSFVFYFGISYVLSVDKNHFINKVLESKLLSYTGKISYGLYVYHLFAYKIIIEYFNFGFWVINFILFIIITYLISSVSYYVYEIYFLRLKYFFKY